MLLNYIFICFLFVQRLWVGRPVYYVKLSLYTRSCFINVKCHYIKKTLEPRTVCGWLVCVVTPKDKMTIVSIWQVYFIHKDIFNAHIQTNLHSLSKLQLWNQKYSTVVTWKEQSNLRLMSRTKGDSMWRRTHSQQKLTPTKEEKMSLRSYIDLTQWKRP